MLFLEYVGAAEFRPSDPAHQDAAARWLGQCHGASACVSTPELVPRRSLDEERLELSTTRLRLSETLGHPPLGEEGRVLVSGVLELLDTAVRRAGAHGPHARRVRHAKSRCTLENLEALRGERVRH